MIGDHNLQTVLEWTNSFYLLEAVTAGLLDVDLDTCYKHFNEVICHVVVPKCDPETAQVIHPYRETCYQLVEACVEDTVSLLRLLKTDWKLSQTQTSSSSGE